MKFEWMRKRLLEFSERSEAVPVGNPKVRRNRWLQEKTGRKAGVHARTQLNVKIRMTELTRSKKEMAYKNDLIQSIMQRCSSRIETKCMEWMGALVTSGYGQTQINGKCARTHRAIFMAWHGIELSQDELVCHKCDNPRCCNIEHLFLGSAYDNMQDMIRKGRQKGGSNNKNTLRDEKFPPWDEIESSDFIPKDLSPSLKIVLYFLTLEESAEPRKIADIIKSSVSSAWTRLHALEDMGLAKCVRSYGKYNRKPIFTWRATTP